MRRKLIVNEETDEGNQAIDFDATNVPSGVYFCRLFVNDNDGVLRYQSIKKMTVIK